MKREEMSMRSHGQSSDVYNAVTAVNGPGGQGSVCHACGNDGTNVALQLVSLQAAIAKLHSEILEVRGGSGAGEVQE